jgi:hypothetical protein
MFHSCNVALEKNENLVSIKRNNYCIIMNVKTGKFGKAKCHKDDINDDKIGFAIAWARYNNIDIPKEVVEKTHYGDLTNEHNRYIVYYPLICEYHENCEYLGLAHNGTNRSFIFKDKYNNLLIVETLENVYVIR